jgi:hypothetical protein
MLPPDHRFTPMVAEVTRLLHAEERREATECFLDFCKVKVKLDNSPKALNPHLTSLLRWLCDNDGLEEAAGLLWKPTQFSLKPESARKVWDLFTEASFYMLMGAGSMGKCIGLNDLCRLVGGGLKKAVDVVQGDQLVGDDGTARTVLNTVRGRSEMFRVSPWGAPSFECNGDHVLSLICSWARLNGGGGKVSSGYTPGTVVDVPVKEYLTWSEQRREAYRLFVAGYDAPNRPVDVDPYVYGAWIGDGTCVRAELTTPEGPMARAWEDYWRGRGFRVIKKEQRGCSKWSVRHHDGDNRECWPNQWFRDSAPGGEKIIRDEYLNNSSSVRLNLLAGIIDADGTCCGAGFDVVTKWDRLADQIEELARGLGFLVTRLHRRHTIKSIGFSAPYHHVRILGDVSRIPTQEKVAKRASSRGITAGFATTRFSIESIGEGDYAGFSLDGNHRFLLGSGIVTHNSYTVGVRMLLEWIRDPYYTTVKVLGPNETHLQDNLFSHLIGLHKGASIPLPGVIGDLFIGVDRQDKRSSISGVIVPIGQNKKAGRLQGGKPYPRPKPHPIFGPLGRLFIFLDEAENIPAGIWFDIDNVMSNLESKDSKNLRIGCAFNPSNRDGHVGKRCEPMFGWDDFNPDKHFRWTSKRDWEVLRLDALQSENIKTGRSVHPGLQTRAGLEQIIKNSGGTDSAGYHIMVRACFPPLGTSMSVVPAGNVLHKRGKFLWIDKPTACGSCDLALEGQASAIFCNGLWGRASGYQLAPSLDFPQGKTVMFTSPRGTIMPRYGLQLASMFALPKGNTPTMKTEIRRLTRSFGIKPEWFCVDRTGHGQGVYDLLKTDWSPAVHGLNYSESATDKKIMEEDSQTCAEAYTWVTSELWFAWKVFLEFGYFLVDPSVDMSRAWEQATQRLYKTIGGRSRVESKKDYISRGHPSPDESDANTLLVHAVRQNITTLSMAAAGTTAQENDEDSGGDWWNRIDESSRGDSLNEDS